MKQKGFTLIELIAVIVILALIALVVFPAINGVLKDSRENAYDSQISIIEKAAKEYYLENYKELPEENGCTYVSIETLISKGYISDEELDEKSQIIDPKTNEPLTGFVEVQYDSNQYNYKFVEENACPAENEENTIDDNGEQSNENEIDNVSQQ